MEEKKLQALNEEELDEVSGGASLKQNMPATHAEFMELQDRPIGDAYEESIVADIMNRESNMYFNGCFISAYKDLLNEAKQKFSSFSTDETRYFCVEVITRAISILNNG